MKPKKIEFSVDADVDFVKEVIKALPKHVTTVVVKVKVVASSQGGGARTSVSVS